VISALGNSRTVTAAHGKVTLTLPGATAVNPQDPHDAPIYLVQTVPLGTHHTPRVAQTGTPSGFPAIAHHRWTTPPTLAANQVIVNPAGDQVAVRTPHGLHVWGTPGTTPGTLNAPVAAVQAHGFVYVANAGNHVVSVFTSTGHFVRQFGGYGTRPGDLLGLSGIAIAANGTVYVTNSGAQNVVAYTDQGQWLRSWGTWGSGSGQFDGPSGIAVGPHGTVYVADTLNQRVQAFSPTGTFLNQMATANPTTIVLTGPETLTVTNGLTDHTTSLIFPHPLPTLPAPAHASAIAVQPSGNYAVATTTGQITTYAANGSEIGLWVLPPAYGNRLPPTITALAWDGSTLYALDGRYNRIFAIHTTLPPLPIQVTKTGLVDNGSVTLLPLSSHLLLGPQALAVTANGSLWVADTDHRRLLHLTPSGQILRTIALQDGPYGVAVLPSGQVVVTGYYGGTVAWVNSQTSPLQSLGFTAGPGLHQLQHPTTVIPLPQGGFAIWDTGNQRAVLTNAAGTPITWITSPADATAMTVLPSGAIAWTTTAGLTPWVP